MRKLTKLVTLAPDVANRICPACGTNERIQIHGPVWPVPWQCPACGHRPEVRNGIPLFAPELADTVAGIDPAILSLLASVEANYFWFVGRNQLIAGLVQRFFPAARSLLEIGCGNGAVLRALAADRRWERLVGSDLHPTGLITARERVKTRSEFVQMDATRIPAKGVFDLIGAFDVLEHIAEDEVALSAMRQALTPGGGVILAVPQHPWLWSREDELGHHQRRYRRGELEDKLRRGGFEIVFSSSFTCFLLPLMAMSRLLSLMRPLEQFDAMREFAIGSFTNRVLTAILRAEVWLTLAGARWPVGGSRVVLARAV